MSIYSKSLQNHKVPNGRPSDYRSEIAKKVNICNNHVNCGIEVWFDIVEFEIISSVPYNIDDVDHYY